jgi:NADH:ubiquinone oxidoreductase subunit F (NADH-binding)/(2Fe-2S) ferredoxin/Pyruvate/2-oxoacid:ferredoxin oxidoreductase delta subunit
MVEQQKRLLEKQLNSVEDLEQLRQSLLAEKDSNCITVSVCGGTGCRASGAEAIVDAFAEEIEKRELQVTLEFKETGCQGFCAAGPVVLVGPEKIFYQHVKPEDVPEIIEETVINGKVVPRLLYKDTATGKEIIREADVPFYKKQSRFIMGANSETDPTKIEQYIAHGGYSALAKVLFEMNSEQIIGEITRSGLRGRGGGGFPTGRKWQSCKDAPGDIKYVICNADEGDPGSYQDGSILGGNPHSVIEGMLIGAYAIGAHHGYIYVRNEYPLAVEHAKIAIQQATEYGLLGNNILGSDFYFRVIINKGGGSFVCGESSALIASLEGRVGEPKSKYTHMAEKGLWDKPSLLNNVKTWATVPLIINKGADWYSKIGTAGSKGTMIFALVGKIVNSGLVEVPMGITLREMVYDIGGGIPGGKKFKAVQAGGPSGGCIPEQYLDTPVDFDELTKLGSMMGSGGMIVMDEDNCMVDVARYFIEFLKGESCGKCSPCREGLSRLSEILDRITRGEGKPEDLDTMQDLGEILEIGALCGLGRSAANPVLTTLRYFKDEYLAHINDKKCPAGVCSKLLTFSIDPEKCTGCGVCAQGCPTSAISGEKKQPHVINTALCIKCGGCFDACKFDAVMKR